MDFLCTMPSHSSYSLWMSGLRNGTLISLLNVARLVIYGPNNGFLGKLSLLFAGLLNLKFWVADRLTKR